MNNFFDQYLQGVLENLYGLYINVIRPQMRKNHKVSLTSQ